jgi:hypothetical protein
MAAWSQDIVTLAKRANLSIDTAIRKATFDLFRSVILKSPVDTGRFRANWNFAVGSADYAVTESTTQSRGLQEAAKALETPSGGVVTLANGLPYARRLEHGYSRQAPVGMVRLSVLEYRKFLLRALDKTA